MFRLLSHLSDDLDEVYVMSFTSPLRARWCILNGWHCNPVISSAKWPMWKLRLLWCAILSYFFFSVFIHSWNTVSSRDRAQKDWQKALISSSSFRGIWNYCVHSSLSLSFLTAFYSWELARNFYLLVAAICTRIYLYIYTLRSRKILGSRFNETLLIHRIKNARHPPPSLVVVVAKSEREKNALALPRKRCVYIVCRKKEMRALLMPFDDHLTFQRDETTLAAVCYEDLMTRARSLLIWRRRRIAVG